MRNMMMLNKRLAVLLLLMPAMPVMAGNVTFLKDSAIAKMTDQDLEMLRSAARNALDYTADGQSRRWENDATGATGIVTPISTSEEGGAVCRQLELFNDAKGFSGRTVFTFCRQPDGTWKVPPSSARGAVPSD